MNLKWDKKSILNSSGQGRDLWRTFVCMTVKFRVSYKTEKFLVSLATTGLSIINVCWEWSMSQMQAHAFCVAVKKQDSLNNSMIV